MMCEERTAVSLLGAVFSVCGGFPATENRNRGHPVLCQRTQHVRINRHSTPHPKPKHTANKSAQRPTSNTQAYSKQIGTAPHIQYPSIQTQVNPLPFFTTKNSLKKARGVCRGAAALRPLCGFLFLHKKRFSHLTRRKNQNSMDGEGFEPSKAVPTDLQSAPFGHSGIHP